MKYSNLALMFHNTCKTYPDKTGLMFKKGGSYQSITYREIHEIVSKLANGLASLGVQKGDKVVLLSENRVEWAWTDYAILSNGAVTVPIYPTLLAPHIKFITNNSDAKVVIVSNEHQLSKVLEVLDELKTVEQLVIIEPGETKHDKLITFQELQEKGAAYQKEHPEEIEQRIQAVEPEDLATIIYTSGTTGEPKGVMLTHKNFLSNIEASLRALPITPDEIFLSFLPLSHVFERMVGHFLATYQGCTIAYAESIETVPQNLLEVRPTLMASVPRFFEKVYGRVMESLEAGSAVKKSLFMWAIGVGKEALRYKQNGKPIPGGLFALKYKLADKLVFSKLKERVGGRIKFFVSGGAPLSKEIGEFFASADLLILEGYGLTETSPVITVNRLEKYKFGSVGLPLDNVEVKIAEDGEILCKGPNVMKGYYKNEAATKEAIDEEGWFHTGDIGVIDEDGFLIITDRKKNLIVTAGGKNVAPQPIENLLITSQYIEQAVVIGDKRKFISALIVPNMDALKAFAQERGITYQSTRELLDHPEVQKLYRQEIDNVSKDLARYETIKKFALIEEPFTIESGELTPTLKVKRRIVEERYKDIIDKMYEEGEKVGA